jgi:hypothetical protein
MPRVSVEVTGLREVVRGLERAGVDVADLKTVFGRIATEAADVGRGFTPRRTGALAGSVRGNKAKNRAVVTWGKASVSYAGKILYGSPRRGIRPAATRARTDAVMSSRAPALLNAGLDDLLVKAGLV